MLRYPPSPSLRRMLVLLDLLLILSLALLLPILLTVLLAILGGLPDTTGNARTPKDSGLCSTT